MTILTFPTGTGIRAVTFGIEYNTQIFESPLNKNTQRLELPGAHWVATYEFPPMKKTGAAEIQAFLLKLRGAANTFYGYDPSRTTPAGIGTGTPVVNGASQTGTSLVTDGWTVNQANIMAIGDYFEVNGELKMMTENAASDSGGNAILNFEPALRSSPADNATITVNNPTCIMRLVDDGQATWSVAENSYFDMRFSAIEAFIS